VPQSDAKDQFYWKVYYITLNSNCEALRVYKKLKKWEKIELEAKMGDLSVHFYFLWRKFCLKVTK
jgi:hypothetical protein